MPTVLVFLPLEHDNLAPVVDLLHLLLLGVFSPHSSWYDYHLPLLRFNSIFPSERPSLTTLAKVASPLFTDTIFFKVLIGTWIISFIHLFTYLISAH